MQHTDSNHGVEAQKERVTRWNLIIKKQA